MQMRQLNRRKSHTHWVLWIILGVILLAIIGYSVLVAATKPINHANQEYSNLVIKKHKLKSVQNFYWSNRSGDYYTLIGKNDKNKKTGVIVNAKTKDMTVLAMNEGKSYQTVKKQVEQKYQPKKITNIGMGIYKKVPVWEVKFIDQNGNLNFITVQFTNGKVVRSINNL
ncbi:DUF5590 domain-containing protein [Weissella koreensis]|uniref:cell wall elongation regulator TseB-like domain-containing protein n=1 Tax=Weissella koreensis TaxID=165096 RepID=UPI0002175731|nr:DUF5590 domain-containing protein [Weissella koreensis]AEJ24116.1 hypothetical protein WKK_06230 [Weissella koreensis KACC 15510]EJF34717.1 hypothetical protein JC2156_15580 [Weissella koreensis KCTC 3621]MCZ9311442.1 DUF5590 domain-containing protein [Weissella koreensis]